MRFPSRLWPSHLATLIVFVVSACGDSGGTPSADECIVGAEGCACTEGGACDGGLDCRSDLCVDLSGDGDAMGDGGSVDGDGDGNGDGDGAGGRTDGSGGLTGDGDGDLGGAMGDGGGDGTGGLNGTGGVNGTGGLLGCDAGRLVLQVTYRDFNGSHESFLPPSSSNQDPCKGLRPGIVAATLDASGKPVYAGDSGTCVSEAGFSEWFVDSNASATLETTLVLFPDGEGGHVNRFGENGEKFVGSPEGSLRWCGNVGDYESCAAASLAGDCLPPAFDPNTEGCWETGESGGEDISGEPLPPGCGSNSFCAGTVIIPTYDGTPLHFPFDGRPEALEDERYPANIAAQYFNGLGWPWEAGGSIGPNPPSNSPLHNFHFTSELRFPFEYDPDVEAEFTFLADDDAFLFVNGHLVVDLGGYHIPLFGVVTFGGDGTVTSRIWQPDDPGVNTDSDVTLYENTIDAVELGLEAGRQYEIQLFDAERVPSGSSFLLKVSGFDRNAACVP